MENVILIVLPSLAIAAIVYRQSKEVQVRICLVLGFFWTCIIFYIAFIDQEFVFGRTPLGLLVNLPILMPTVIVSFIQIIAPGLSTFLGFLQAALTYIISYFIIFYIYRLIGKCKPRPLGTDNHNQQQKNG